MCGSLGKSGRADLHPCAPQLQVGLLGLLRELPLEHGDLVNERLLSERIGTPGAGRERGKGVSHSSSMRPRGAEVRPPRKGTKKAKPRGRAGRAAASQQLRPGAISLKGRESRSRLARLVPVKERSGLGELLHAVQEASAGEPGTRSDRGERETKGCMRMRGEGACGEPGRRARWMPWQPRRPGHKARAHEQRERRRAASGTKSGPRRKRVGPTAGQRVAGGEGVAGSGQCDRDGPGRLRGPPRRSLPETSAGLTGSKQELSAPAANESV